MLIADFKTGILALGLETKQLEVVMDRFNEERLKGPNDLVLTHHGSIVFTDQGMSGLQDPSGGVYRITPTGCADVLLQN
jgi:gluconolactonase